MIGLEAGKSAIPMTKSSFKHFITSFFKKVSFE